MQCFSHPDIPNYLLVIFFFIESPWLFIGLYFPLQVFKVRKPINLEQKNCSASQYIPEKYGLVNAFNQHTSKTLHHIMALQTKCPPTHLPQEISQLEQRFCSLPKINSFLGIFKKIRLRQKIKTITSESTRYN